MHGDNPSDIARFSFWKPDPIPPKNSTILPIELHSLGPLKSVAEKLLDVPKMSTMPAVPWEVNAERSVSLVWDVEDGVILQVRAEQGPPKPGEVLTINAKSSTPEKVFYRLYVQIYEHFGATVLDEKSHQFYTPKEFRTKL
jgi:hypothetical protein